MLDNPDLERVQVYAGVAALTEQGVTSLMERRRPCRRLEGVGSLHFSRDFSTQSIMASPFLESE